MAIDERTRHRLFLRLEAVLGEQDAEVLMEHLPPVGWADVATKQDVGALRQDIARIREDVIRDLDALEERMGLRLTAEIANVRVEIRDSTRALVFWCAPMILTGIGLTFAAARLS